MGKPEHQWETRLHRARRRPDAPDPSLGHSRARQVFDLEFADGHLGQAVCDLERQQVDAVSWVRDPDLGHAVACWLVARGQRRMELADEARQLLRAGPISSADLGDTPPAQPPLRVITLAPSCVEVVHELGAFDRVVACEDSSDFPPGVDRLTRLGPDLGPDLDAVARLAPDLVVSSLSVPGMERVVTGLRARGLPQVVLAPRTLDEIRDDLGRVARHLHAEAAGAQAVSRFDARRRALLRARPAEPARVYLEWWPRPMFTPGRDCYSNEVLDLAGAVNAFGDRPGSSLEISADELLAADPDLCVVSWCGVREDRLDPEHLRARAGLDELRAARLGRVRALDEALMGRPGPRILEAAERLAAMVRDLATGSPVEETPPASPGVRR